MLADPDGAVVEAAAAGVTRIVCMGLDAGSTRGVLELCARHPGVRAGAGHHPTASAAPDLGALRELVQDPRVVCVGEVGLDFAHADRAPDADQVAWLDALFALAREADLPVSIHNREAEAALLEVVARHPGLRGVMHYWSLGWEWAERFLEAGLHISFSGLLTRPSRDNVREVARRMPADRLLLETDSPFGSPHGRQQEQNRPAWMLDTARRVAELRGVALEELAEIEERNARRLFTRLT